MTESIDHLRAAFADRYSLERLLGEGGMATVYLALDPRHDRAVAIKVLRPELAASLGAERFLREIKLAARLQHPNILGLHDSGEAAGFLYYVMPFVEGESLRDRLNREQQLPIEDAVGITCQIADALQYAHSHGVIHRDIKPENVLLQNGHALVADFGVAKALHGAVAVSTTSGLQSTTLTQAGTAVGTPYYMSPEQGAGDDHLDGRSDQYSLACVLYEMLIGQPPFTGLNPMAVLARHSMETVPSLQVVRRAVPDGIEDAVMRALEKTPADRFPTMHDFLTALAGADLDPAIRRTSSRAVPALRRTTPRATPTKRVMPTPQRMPHGRWVWVWVAAGLVLLTSAGWVGWHRLTGRANAPAAAAASFDPNRIAVLYFESAPDGSDSLVYLADGLTEALIHELSGVPQLRVISSNGVRRYQGSEVDVQQVARELKAGTIVRGTIAQSSGRLRVSVALIDAASLEEIGSTKLERPRTELFMLQDELARDVSVVLRRQLGHEIQLRATRSATQNVAAWELFQRAHEEAKEADTLVSVGDTVAAERKFKRTDSLLAKVEGLDPKWPAPATLRAWLTFRQSRMALSAPPSFTANLVARGLQHVERALALDPKNADALEARGTLRYWKWLNNLAGTADADQLFQDAERDLQASVDLNPGQASAWTTLSHLLINKPSPAEAKLAALRAYEADPYVTNANVTVWRLFLTSYDLEDVVEAKRWCEEGQQRFAADVRFVECQLWYSSMKGVPVRPDEVWPILERYNALSPPSLRPLNQLKGQMRVAMVLARAGLADSARRVTQRSLGDPGLDPERELAELGAIVYTILGDKDEAFKQLSLYIASNPQQRQKTASWEFRGLENDPRFRVLLGRGR